MNKQEKNILQRFFNDEINIRQLYFLWVNQGGNREDILPNCKKIALLLIFKEIFLAVLSISACFFLCKFFPLFGIFVTSLVVGISIVRMQNMRKRRYG